MDDRELPLFSAFGIEVEYMIVRDGDLNVAPLADRVLDAAGADGDTEVEVGDLAWSNELALHVIELKTNGPSATLDGLGRTFADHVARVERLLAPHGARLMPTAMHPWMDPAADTALWPHADADIYRAFDRIFGCRGHGWVNLQSIHVNLPFRGDREFAALHAACRVALPILPALAASSPICDGRVQPTLDTRMVVYRDNAARVPSVTGAVVPEPVYSRAEYEGDLLARIYRDLAPLDPAGVLRHEWVNARGCIARFDRSTIEIRVLDTQECAQADLAVAGATIETVRALVEERWAPAAAQKPWHHARLAELLDACVRDGDRAVVRDRDYLDLFAFPERSARAGELWQYLVEEAVSRAAAYPEWRRTLDIVRDRGCLARRIRDAVQAGGALRDVYARLCDCLRNDIAFV